MTQQTMRINIGPPVTDNNYYPRHEISDKLTRVMQNEHVLFLAPRRTGKTSILKYLEKNSAVPAVYLNLEKINHPEDWIKRMALEISKIRGKSYQLMFQASELIPRIKLKGTELSANSWQKQADNLTDILNQFNQPLWFLLDEFPIMIDHIAKKHGVTEATQTLHWFRHLRQENTNSPIRFLITGSIGLDSVLRRHGIRGPANDLRRETLQPLTDTEALQLCLKLANDNRLPLTEILAQDYIQRLGPARWPFFLQLFVAELEDAHHCNDVLSVDSIYQAVVKNKGSRNAYCENMWDRLKDIFNDVEAATARQLLKRLAVSANGISQEQLRSQLPQLEEQDFNYVVEVLQHDGYLCETDSGCLSFFSYLLRDYWCNKERLV